jgi:hypothetical protein
MLALGCWPKLWLSIVDRPHTSNDPLLGKGKKQQPKATRLVCQVCFNDMHMKNNEAAYFSNAHFLCMLYPCYGEAGHNKDDDCKKNDPKVYCT